MGAQELRTKPRRRWQEIGTAYVMLLPSLIGVGLFLIVPFFLVFAISLTDWNLINPPSFIGIANYEYIFSGSDFSNSLLVTVVFTLMALPTAIILGLLIALGLNR